MATIKAGTYRFKDVLTAPDNELGAYDEWLYFENNGKEHNHIYCALVGGDTPYVGLTYISHPTWMDEETYTCQTFAHSDYGWLDESCKVITLSSDQEVGDEFAAWFAENTVEVVEDDGTTEDDSGETTPVATVTYNGETIASLFGGQRATLKCEGLKMESDVTVEVGGTTAPLSVSENGVYDTAYKTAKHSWKEESDYDFTVTVDGTPLRVKKLESFAAPEDIEHLTRPGYAFTLSQGQETQTWPLKDLGLLSLDGYGYILQELLYAVVWIRDADLFNEMAGEEAFEDNTVYVTDLLWTATNGELAGFEMTLSAPGEKVDSISSVTVDVQPALQEKTVTENGEVTPDEGYDGLSKVTVEVENSGGGAVVMAKVKQLTITKAAVTADGTSLTIGA